MRPLRALFPSVVNYATYQKSGAVSQGAQESTLSIVSLFMLERLTSTQRAGCADQ